MKNSRSEEGRKSTNDRYRCPPGAADDGRGSDDRDVGPSNTERPDASNSQANVEDERIVLSNDDIVASADREDNQARNHDGVVVVPNDLLVVPENNNLVRDRDPRTRGIRRGVSIISWVTGIMLGGIAYIGGLPAGTVLFLIVSGVGYVGSEIGGHLVVARLNRLEGGNLLAIAERAGNIRHLENIGDRFCFSIINLSLGTRHARPNSIANSAERARIQDRGVEFCALLTAIGYGGLNVVRFGITAELLNSLVMFTGIMTVGRGYLVAVRRGTELHLNNIPRIRAISDPMERRAKILLRSLYAPTAIGDFLIWCGVVGRPLVNAGLMLPFGLVAKFLPQSGRSFLTGMVGLDVISDIHEAFISAELLTRGVLPENVEEVASKKTLKYKITKSILYALIPFLPILITYLVLYYHYQLAVHIPTEISVISFVVLAAIDFVAVWCNFEKLDRFIGGVLSSCSGICFSKDEHVIAKKTNVSNAPVTVNNNGHRVANSDSGNVADDSLDRSVRIGDVARTRSAFSIFNRAAAELREPAASAAENTESSFPRVAHTRVSIDPEAIISKATLRKITQQLNLKNIGTTPQGRQIQVLEPGQKSSTKDLQKAIELDSTDKLIFVTEPADNSILHLHLSDVTNSRQERGVSINMNRVDFLFDRYFGLSIDQSAFASAIRQLQLNPVGVTPVGRAIYVISPGQTSRDRHVQRLLQLENSGTRHCFVACASTGKSVYCPLAEIFGSNMPSALDIERNIGKADVIFDIKVRESEDSAIDDDDAESSERPVFVSSSNHGSDDDDDNAGGVFATTRRTAINHLRPSAVAYAGSPYGDEEEEVRVFEWRTGPRRVHYSLGDQDTRVIEIDDDSLPPLAPRNSGNRVSSEEELDEVDTNQPFGGVEEIFVGDGVENIDSQIGFRGGVGINVHGLTNEPVSPEKKRGLGAAFSSMFGAVSSGVSSLFSRFSRRKTTTDREPVSENLVTSVTAAQPAVVEAITVTDSDEDNTDTDKRSEESSGDSNANNDSGEYEGDDVDNQKSVSQEWYYDDRKSINGVEIDLSVFQENASKALEITLPKINAEKLHDKYNNERKTYRQYFEELTKEIEERSVVKPWSYFDEEEQDEEEQDILDKLLSEVTGTRSILPKKYDIPDDISFVPPHTITFSSLLPNMPFIPTYNDISSYFYQAVESGINGGKQKAQEMLVTDTSFSMIFFSLGIISNGLLGEGSKGAGGTMFNQVFEHALSV